MQKLPLSGFEVFLAVAENGSLRAAATALGVHPPAVSHQLKVFEEQIGIPLFIRSTRSIRITEAGQVLLKRARPAMAELDDALEEARGVGKTAKGTIRITVPYVAYQMAIAAKIGEFYRRYPDIEVELSFNEAFVDIIVDGFHAGVRLGDRINQDMVAVRLTPPLSEACFASPQYFAAHGRPETPADLLKHNCIRYRFIASQRLYEWRFRGKEGEFTVDTKGNLIVNSFRALVESVKDGLGIGQFLKADIMKDIQSETLETVLDSFAISHPGFFIYYPKGNSKIQALRAFIDFMKAS